MQFSKVSGCLGAKTGGFIIGVNLNALAPRHPDAFENRH